MFDIKGLPLHQKIVDSVVKTFFLNEDVVAGALIGSLSNGKGDRISDVDIIIFTKNDFHKNTTTSFAEFEKGKDVFYSICGDHNDKASFRKYIFHDLTSAEIHCVDLAEGFELSSPNEVLFDKANFISTILSSNPAPKHEDFPVYTAGDEGLIWELFDCLKWLSRGNKKLAKDYIKKLAKQL
ncbi:hypothetical protein [Photobacterium indicum]|uniref:hypothetical protein n=1 Tax=Photobacterium indicum TaxID=81447 RepID=UPI003D127E7C